MRKKAYCALAFLLTLLSCTKNSGNIYQIPPPPFLSLALITTTYVSAVTENSASTGGDVTNDGGTSITAKGVCWGISPSPTVMLATKTMNGTGTGPFSSSLAGLTKGTTYYVRAYATNILGTAYGNEVVFVATNQPTLPVLITHNSAGITTSSASCGGDITNEGNAPVTARGICWGLSVNPSITHNAIPAGSGPGAFNASITGLMPATTYHVRAYATNSVGTAYGNDISFTTAAVVPPPPASVTICSQVWMSRNLDVVSYRNGDPIPQVSDPVQWKNLTTGAWTYVNGDPSTNATYGKLYNWYAVNDSRGLAPTGWHVPSYTEFASLANCLGGDYLAGGKLKTVGTTDWMAPNTGATNSSGFSALPGGKRNNQGVYGGFGYSGELWTSTQQLPGNSWAFHIYYLTAGTGFPNPEKMEGLPVRCIKD